MAGTGGYRPGAGRKPNKIKELAAEGHKFFLGRAANDSDLAAKFRELLNCGQPKVEIQAAIYLADRRYGKAPQKMEHEGSDGGPIRIIADL